MISGLSGVFAATLTPYRNDGPVSPGVVSSLTSSLINAGLSGTCPAGTTGEFPMLSREEKGLVNTVAASCGGTVIAGIWGALADERADLARRAGQDGARALFLTTPIFFKSSPESTLAWYRSVRQVTALPIFAYSIPQHTGNPIALDVLEKLADEGTINGFKDSSGDLDWLVRVIGRLKGRITIFAGHEGIFAPALEAGVDGFISGIAGVFPKTVLAVWHREPGAVDRLLKVRQALHEAGTIPGLKYLSKRRGFDCGNPREPLLPPSGAALEPLDRLLEDDSLA